MKTTARDIARLCNTSLSAVSRAFRADGAISKELRAQILAEAARHGYTPPAQRARKRRKSLSFAVICGELGNPFNPLALKTFAAQADLLGWDMVTFVVPETGEIDGLMDRVLAADIDAVVIASADLSSGLARRCKDGGRPAVFFNRVQVDAEMTAICSDNYGGAILAANRLLSQGRTRLAFVGGRTETSTHLERRRGFIDTLETARVPLSHDEIGNFEYEQAYDIGRDLFAGSRPPDGVFCANDNMGLALIDAAHAANLHPGRDVSIIGYDDVAMAHWTRYQLTTISQQVDVMVDRTLALVARVATERDAGGQIEIVPAKLIERDSG